MPMVTALGFRLENARKSAIGVAQMVGDAVVGLQRTRAIAVAPTRNLRLFQSAALRNTGVATFRLRIFRPHRLAQRAGLREIDRLAFRVDGDTVVPAGAF